MNVVGGELADVALHKDWSGAENLSGKDVDGLLADELLLTVDVGVTLDFVVGHVGEGSHVARGSPSGIAEGGPGHGELQVTVEVFGVRGEGVDGSEVGVHAVNIFLEEAEVLGGEGVVLLDLVADVLAGLVDDVPVVEPFDAGFEHERDEETDGDGGDVKEEVAPAVDGLVRWVNVEQRGSGVRRCFG